MDNQVIASLGEAMMLSTQGLCAAIEGGIGNNASQICQEARIHLAIAQAFEEAACALPPPDEDPVPTPEPMPAPPARAPVAVDNTRYFPERTDQDGR